MTDSRTSNPSDIDLHLIALKYDICDKSADCEPCRGIREKSIEVIERLQRELVERKASFDLRWKASQRAIKRWQEAHPGNDLVWPDHADLCVWLLEQLDARCADEPPAVLEGINDALTWLLAAIQCGNFRWDVDQKEAATDSLNRAKAELRGLRPPSPPEDVRQASYDAANERNHPWYWIQQHAVTNPHMGLRAAVQLAWEKAHPVTKSETCEQCEKPLPSLAQWSMPSCPECVEKAEAVHETSDGE